ncbi:O-6-methylguanine DNA methyltransferase [Caldisphaera lagunensis DSM 15908]|uniref:Methylated-DNA--protein-cysteine methyltransferase n=1 Tax=Caldisphaera lagunensis (strain DSM 15908 / JCM 11604 / ANMR 0165 / IC-154) TaxID=1056495 RepID=L0AA50_CALLD|nr:MGMT family protein [Caldisphaera lagunensis]AFZ70736.1 O-6-methylguanine DNA methyltransferase [Caldisphaera lagunensis DSM 15908]
MDEEILYDVLEFIPMGYVTTYKALGKFLGINQRKVAYLLKNNKNPIIVPCHRVVMSNGELGGYTPYGKNFKKSLLESEGVKIVNGKVDKKCIIEDLSLLEKFY